MITNENNLTQLQVLASSICNLNCEYCYLQDNEKNNAYTILNNQIQKAWLDGTYVKNIEKVFNELNSDPNKMETISFWGGEPLIMIKNLLPSIKPLFSFFPNINMVFFSTNFSKIDNLIDLICLLDEIKQNKLLFMLQLSIDAPPGELQSFGHKVDWKIYKKNIDDFFKELSTRNKLKNTKIDFLFHSAFSAENILKYLNTYDKIKKYCDYFHDFYNYINMTADFYNLKNYITITRDTIFPIIAEPSLFTVEQGLKLKKIMKIITYIQNKIEYSSNYPIYKDCIYSIGEDSIYNKNRTCFTNGEAGITLLHDGTIVECFGGYILNSPEYWKSIKDNPLKRKTYREALLKKRLYINPLKIETKEKNDYNWYIYNNIKDNTSTTIHLIFNLALEMAKSGDIDYIYYENPEKLLKHLIQFNHEAACIKDQLQMVSTTHLVSVNVLRKYLNGVAEYGQRSYLENERWKAKNEI